MRMTEKAKFNDRLLIYISTIPNVNNLRNIEITIIIY